MMNSGQCEFDRCPDCDVLLYYEVSSATRTCVQCGRSKSVLVPSIQSFHERGNYNRNRRHIYQKKEHFFQTLLDMTCTGRRKASPSSVAFCRALLGRGRHITHKMVFKALQDGGYKGAYNSKYEIAARLRGRPEIVLTTRETEMLRGHYNRYDTCFHEFQVKHNIGNKTQSGRLRLFWPVRFIMSEMLKLVGREDLIVHVKCISSTKRRRLYARYWQGLRKMTDRRRPPARRTKLILTKLPMPGKRVSYREYLQMSRQEKPRSSSSSNPSLVAFSQRTVQA